MASLSSLKKRALHFFTGGKRGEVSEIREDLHASSSTVRKHALRQTIASMTVGKDMAPLFTDVVNCGQTSNLQMKKLVYLYIMYYAKNQPDLAILAVNSFVKDAQDPNPLIRAIAIRTMSCIRLERIAEYLVPPLRQALTDPDPYVRKTAALAVAKLYDVNPTVAIEGGFLDALRNLLQDGNAVVLSNAIAAWLDIRRRAAQRDDAARSHLSLEATHIRRLLVALPDCGEWGQLTLLEALSLYDPQHAAEAKIIVERLTSRLQHANCAVVLMTIRILWRLLERFPTALSESSSGDFKTRKMLPALVSLVSSAQPPEVAYVALRILHIFMHTNSAYLEKHYQSFFCDFNEPSYVKQEKIGLLMYVLNAANANAILAELQRYANDVEQNLATRAVDAIGFAGLRCEAAAPAAVEALLSLARRGAPQMTERVLVAVTVLLRQYGNRFQAAAEKFVQLATAPDDEHGQVALVRFEDERARVALLWLVGAYAPLIFCDVLRGSIWAAEQEAGFLSETHSVQSQILSSLARLYGRARQRAASKSTPEAVSELRAAAAALEHTCQVAIAQSGRPEVRARALFYRWLLDQEAPSATTSSITLSEVERLAHEEKPPAIPLHAVFNEDPALLQEFQDELGSIASVLGLSSHRLAWVRSTRFETQALAHAGSDMHPERAGGVQATARVPLPATATATATATERSTSASRSVPSGNEVPLPAAPDHIPPRLLLSTEAGHGLRITGGLVRSRTSSSSFDETHGMQLRLLLENIAAAQGVGDFAIQLNKNIFGVVAPPRFTTEPPILQRGDSAVVVLPLTIQKEAFADQRANLVQIAIKCTPLGVLYFSDTIPVMEAIHATPRSFDRAAFLDQWNRLGSAAEERFNWERAASQTVSDVRTRLRALTQTLSIMAERWLQPTDASVWQVFWAAQMGLSAPLLGEMVVESTPPRVALVVRSQAPKLVISRLVEMLQHHLTGNVALA